MEDNTMTIVQIAGYLGMSQKNVLELAEEGVIPGNLRDNEWEFKKTLIKEWLFSRMSEAGTARLLKVIQTQNNLIPLPFLISVDRIIMDMYPGSKEDILKQLIKPLAEQGVILNTEAYLSELLKREEMVSTAIRDGVAMPHVRNQNKNDITQSCIVLGICSAGTEFGALDGKPTRLFFLICAQSTVIHLRFLAKVSFMLRKPGFIKLLQEATSREDVMELLLEAHYDLSVSF